MDAKVEFEVDVEGPADMMDHREERDTVVDDKWMIQRGDLLVGALACALTAIT
jgi:hypothetical protein